MQTHEERAQYLIDRLRLAGAYSRCRLRSAAGELKVTLDMHWVGFRSRSDIILTAKEQEYWLTVLFQGNGVSVVQGTITSRSGKTLSSTEQTLAKLEDAVLLGLTLL